MPEIALSAGTIEYQGIYSWNCSASHSGFEASMLCQSERIRISLEDEPGFASVTLLRGQTVRFVYGAVLPVGRGDL